LRLLFVKDALAWPRASGNDVHSYHMMRALAELGHTVALATVREPAPEAICGLTLERCVTLDSVSVDANAPGPTLGYLQERFRSYWGVEPQHIRAVRRISDEMQADAVVVVGLGVLPYLAGLVSPLRIWYAADEWVWHHLSQTSWLRPHTWGNLQQSLIKGLYERVYGPLLDGIWVVSATDQRAMRWVSGARGVDVIANGVDSDHFRPDAEPSVEHGCVFWGRLDFGPNVQALQWFCNNVWPLLHREVPSARFTIYGFQPTAAVQALAGRDGITMIPDLPDLRGEVARYPVVVFPFVSGGGIKNKLLEAAAMGKAIVCTPRATCGVRGGELPFAQARRRGEWVQEIQSLWSDAARRRRLEQAARQWVLEHHTWRLAADLAVASLEDARRRSSGPLSRYYGSGKG
jgi:glycosyltransferase involved in cell wall biosynthesis